MQEGVQIQILLPTTTILLCEPAECPVSLLFPQIVAQLATDYDFFLSPDQLQLISAESDKMLQNFIEPDATNLDLHLIRADSVILVKNCVEHKTISVFGIPPDSSLGRLWQVLDAHYPDMVGFPRNYRYSRRALDVYDPSHVDSEQVMICVKDSELFVDLVPKSQAIFTTFCIDSTTTEVNFILLVLSFSYY